MTVSIMPKGCLAGPAAATTGVLHVGMQRMVRCPVLDILVVNRKAVCAAAHLLQKQLLLLPTVCRLSVAERRWRSPCQQGW